MKILLIGPPASGKGTIGNLLGKKLGIPLINVGQLLRDIPKDFPNYQKIKETMDAGGLPANDLVAGVLKNRLAKSDVARGYILDGWGRRADDLEKFNPGFDLAIYLVISEETSVRRISGRRVCLKDGSTYNVFTLPPKRDDFCDICGGPLTHRTDDNEEVVKNRLNIFKNETLPAIEVLRKSGVLVEVPAEGAPEEIFAKIVESLEK